MKAQGYDALVQVLWIIFKNNFYSNKWAGKKKKKSFKSSKLGDQNNVSIYDTDEEFGEERLGGKIMKSSFQFCVSDVGR